MKVYAVFYSYAHVPCISCVFTTKELADDFIKNSSYKGDMSIVEFTVLDSLPKE